LENIGDLLVMAFPELPPKLRTTFDQLVPGYYNWYQDFKNFMVSRFMTQGDVTCLTKRKGIVLTNAAGTVTKRIRLNDLGTGLIIEDV
jgi:hypothetical protein